MAITKVSTVQRVEVSPSPIEDDVPVLMVC